MGNRLLAAPHHRGRQIAATLTGIRRPLAIGLSVGCLVGLLGFYVGALAPLSKPSRANLAESTPAARSPAPAESMSDDLVPDSLPPATPDATPALADSWSPEGEVLASSTPEEIAPAEIAMDEFVVRAAPKIEMEVGDMWVSNRAVAAVIVLKRTGSKQGPARVRWKTLPGTATPAKDYESKSNMVKFADGQAMRTVFVPIVPQPSGSDSRTFSVVLERAPSGSALGSITSTTVTILGDS